MQNSQVQTILRKIPTLHKISSSHGNDAPLLSSSAERRTKTSKKSGRKTARRKMRALAEAVILQSVEDLWSRTNRRKSIEFFMGDGFSLCAEMAGMKIIDRLRLFRMLRKIEPGLFDSRHARRIGSIVNTGG